jgi:hypothetical protein
VNAATIIENGAPATRLFNALSGSNELTLEAWIIPDNTGLNGPARILTLSEDPLLRNFTLGQEFDAIEARLRTTTTDDNGFPPLVSLAGSATTNLSHVVYTRKADGQATLYINNNIVANETRDGNFSNWNNQYHLALANELSLDRAWLGTYHLAAIFNRELSTAEVAQNYQAGPRPESQAEGLLRNYLPALLAFEGGGCGNSAVTNDNSAVTNNGSAVTNPVSTGSDGSSDQGISYGAPSNPVPNNISRFVAVAGILLVVGLSAMGVYTFRERLQS